MPEITTSPTGVSADTNAQPELRVEIKDGVGVLTMNRPDKLNALSLTMNKMAVEVLDSFSANPAVKVVLLTGSGKGFCAGGDVGAMRARNEMGTAVTLEEKIDALRVRHRFSWLLYSLNKVTIAAVNGVAAGAGVGLALSCDLRIASDKARFVTAYAKVGYGGDYGTTWQLTQLLGPARAKAFMFSSDPIGVEQALSWGMVNEVAPQEGFAAAALDYAQRIAKGPQTSYRYMKANVNLATIADFATMLDREADAHTRCSETADHQEGVQAFMEKRPPVFGKEG